MAFAIVQTSPIIYGDTDADFGADTTSGNDIIVVIWSWQTGLGSGTGAVTDDKGNTYTYAYGAGATNCNVAVWYCENITGGAGHTMGIIGDNSVVAFAIEVTGLDTTPLDKTAGASGSSSTAAPGSTGTLSQADEVLIAVGSCAYIDGTDHIGTPSGYTVIGYTDDNNAHQSGGGFYKVVSATTAENPSMAMDASVEWVATVVSFKLSAGGGGGPTVKALAALGVG